ncbi:hypothetical protein HV346_08730 [Enterobacter sp. RHBSTW-00994]|uniref:hypothetical protein n=1 Tax=Enterobacter sp. RHBSTW-00994 TaxID=2742676 RepID=UPI0015E9E2A3|nr:hypothetical protein [Enterobacter sp. RHBSTW-00994]QLR41161.1 hypothetical protein HV346_08730 [Enterobacter sp. RHBSTW-00994]
MITEKNNVFYCDCGFFFQRGRSGAHDCADGLRNKLADSEAKCAALAAEVYDLKHPGTYLPSKRETPALDAFLAEVRASAITDALKSLDGVFDTDCVMESNGISYEDAEQRTAGAYAVSKALDEFAAQFRKGVQS